MYESAKIAETIKNICKEKEVVIKTMLDELGFGSNTMSAMYHGKSIAHDRLAKIADYLDISIDYLLGRTDSPTIRDAGAVLKELPLPPQHQELMSNLSDENLRAVVEFAEHLASKQNS